MASRIPINRNPAAGLALRQRAEALAQRLPPLLVEAERVAATVAQGVHGRRRVGSGDAFWQFRRYQPGDTAGQIDWRQSAKRQRYYVRQNEWAAAESLWLWRDASASMAYRSTAAADTKQQRAELLLLALASLLLRGGERVALLSGDADDRVPVSGRLALERLASRLLLNDTPTEDLPPAVPLPRFSRVVLLGDFLAPLQPLELLVRGYAGQGVSGHLLQILDPAEEDLPFTGRTWFEGLQDEGRHLAPRAEALRPAYRARLAQHRAEIAGICRAAGWSFATHRSDLSPAGALLALHAALAGAPALSLPGRLC